MPNINDHWLKIKGYTRNTEKSALNLFCFIWEEQSKECILSRVSSARWWTRLPIARRTENQCNFNANFFHYFVYIFNIFSQWPLIIQFNTSLYRFVLKFVKFVCLQSSERWFSETEFISDIWSEARCKKQGIGGETPFEERSSAVP